MMRNTMSLLTSALSLALAFAPGAAQAIDNAAIERVDGNTLRLRWSDRDPVTVYRADRPDAPLEQAVAVSHNVRGGTVTVAVATGERPYFILRDGGDGAIVRLAERVLPLQQGSNFRDIGGYTGADGLTVKWGRIYRSGAMPLLTEQDYALLGRLGIGTVVDLRSTDERAIAPDQLDDRTGALFVSNDYSLKPMMASMTGGDGEYMYRGVGKALVYHCSAGQDRTGVATALVLSALGVDRKTIIADYHMSTALRRPQFEMPPLDPADWPGNAIVPYYVASAKAPGGPKAEPLFTPKGNSHLVQFFEVIDRDYGGVEGYLKAELGVSERDIARLRTLYLE